MKNEQRSLPTEQETPEAVGAMVEMMALSVQQPHASHIVAGHKLVEYRTWATNYRGPLLIVASKKPLIADLPSGQAVGIVQLVDCQQVERLWHWLLADARRIEPFAVRGQLGLYRVDVPKRLLAYNE